MLQADGGKATGDGRPFKTSVLADAVPDSPESWVSHLNGSV